MNTCKLTGLSFPLDDTLMAIGKCILHNRFNVLLSCVTCDKFVIIKHYTLPLSLTLSLPSCCFKILIHVLFFMTNELVLTFRLLEEKFLR